MVRLKIKRRLRAQDVQVRRREIFDSPTVDCKDFGLGDIKMVAWWLSTEIAAAVGTVDNVMSGNNNEHMVSATLF